MNTGLRVYGAPALLCALSIGGLVLALAFDGALEIVALVLVACPIAVITRFFLRLRSSEGQPSEASRRP